MGIGSTFLQSLKALAVTPVSKRLAYDMELSEDLGSDMAQTKKRLPNVIHSIENVAKRGFRPSF
jgi:hypothetical protein